MKNYIFTMVFLLSSAPLFAQMAEPSIFSAMKSFNPAVISYRLNSALSMVAKVDHSKKEQDLSVKYGEGSTLTERGTISTYNAFYGGQGDRNGGLTSEMQVNLAHGNLIFGFDLTNDVQGDSELDGTADMQFIEFGFGFWRFFGLSFAHMGTATKSTFTSDLEGNVISTSSKSETTINRLRFGLRLPLVLSLGLYVDHIIMENKATYSDDQNIPDEDEKDSNNTIGAGLGFNIRLLHLEGFVEKVVKENKGTMTGIDGNIISVTYHPMRIGGTAELRLGKLTLGYTGLYYIDGFSDLERMIYDSLMYGASSTEKRLENTFNFSLGNEKGHVFGGSAFYTRMKNQEASRLDSQSKYPTTVTVMGLSVKYSYAF